LKALVDLMRTPEVRDTVVAFRTVLQVARKQIDTVASYKDIHDDLHRLQIDCYDHIVAHAPTFSTEATRDLIDQLGLSLQEIMESLQDHAARPSIANNDTSWIQDLIEARDKLSGALKDNDADQLAVAAWHMNRVLSTQPSNYNARLNMAARDLRLRDLVTALRRVRDRVASSDLQSDELGRFEDGIGALERLEVSLTAGVTEHDRWQAIDDELRRISGTMNWDLQELERSWPSLKGMVALLCSASTDDWARDIETKGKTLERELGGDNQARIRDYFKMYKRRTGIQFYRIDTKLKALCESLRQVGEPLGNVLGVLE